MSKIECSNLDEKLTFMFQVIFIFLLIDDTKGLFSYKCLFMKERSCYFSFGHIET